MLICNHQVVSSTLTGGSIFKALSTIRLGFFCAPAKSKFLSQFSRRPPCVKLGAQRFDNIWASYGKVTLFEGVELQVEQLHLIRWWLGKPWDFA